MRRGGTLKSMKRASRRAATKGCKTRAQRVLPHPDPETLADHMAVCSCWMCRNPRRYFGERTLRERMVDLALRESKAVDEALKDG